MDTFHHDGLLGTVVEVRIAAPEAAAATIDAVVVGEIRRLEAVFSAFAPSSELCRWRSGQGSEPSAELRDVLAAASKWMRLSDGGFNPLVGELTSIWHAAADAGVMPSSRQLEEAAAAIAEPRFQILEGEVVQVGDCTSLNLNAIAKGYIVDRAIEAAMAKHPTSVTVNAGGDLAHRGSGVVRAGIENPHRPYDNEPPLMVIQLSNAALATSGDARRGFRVNGRWLGHVIDPRTARPVDDIASISVTAPDAMTADVVATVAGVMAPLEAVAYLEQLAMVEGFVIDSGGQQLSTSGWGDLVLS